MEHEHEHNEIERDVLLDAVSELVQANYGSPFMTTRAVVVFEGVTLNGNRSLAYTQSGCDDIIEALGLLNAGNVMVANAVTSGHA